MELGSIFHRCAYTDCYPLNENELMVNLRTGKDVTAVSLIHDDPFAGGAMGFGAWDGHGQPMTLRWELPHHNIWSVTLRPKFKREQYYFSITAGDETILRFEDGFYTREEAQKPGRLRQYYRFPWMNASDIPTAPNWVGDTIWYQIMPDRFRRGDPAAKRFPLRNWEDPHNIRSSDFYGGDLKGITEKLPYLRDLGITGIYMTPIFLSDTHHKYNTFSYETVDPDFGTEADVITMVETAHSLGIRVMLDAVFNHSGTQFFPWTDVLENGPKSAYWDWFYVNKWPLNPRGRGTEDGRFYAFAFTGHMPKLNTGNPQVARYFTDRCKYWLENWHIDGIRFDVGNEVSHSFLKQLHRELKQVNPEVFLLGEIWHDSLPWLQGDEYDSVMNYPFMQSLHNFWLDAQSSRDLMYSLNRCYTLYPEQTNRVLFNFLDTHDTMRLMTRCGCSKDVFYQQLTLLMTLPGTPCIYYGTEVCLEGGNDPDCRRPMPWKKIEAGQWKQEQAETAALIALRKKLPQLSGLQIQWHHSADHPRLIHYRRTADGERSAVTVYINAGSDPVPMVRQSILYSRKLEKMTLLPGGIAVTLE